ncbi:MAG: HesB/IscA family protein [Planctomycetota bacterium]|jgi:iron-sulfur cluster assembly protein
MITVTEKAVSEVRRMIADQGLEPETFLRLGVSGGGCSGYSYVLGFDKEDKEGDVVKEFHDLKVVLSSDAVPYLDNTVVDFNDDVMNRGFVFNNPNASGTCGCGSSFSV